MTSPPTVLYGPSVRPSQHGFTHNLRGTVYTTTERLEVTMCKQKGAAHTMHNVPSKPSNMSRDDLCNAAKKGSLVRENKGEILAKQEVTIYTIASSIECRQQQLIFVYVFSPTKVSSLPPLGSLRTTAATEQ